MGHRVRNQQQVIELFLIANQGWFARFVNDENVVELFGTDTLPTAFTSSANFETVQAEIQSMNPQHEIRSA